VSRNLSMMDLRRFDKPKSVLGRMVAAAPSPPKLPQVSAKITNINYWMQQDDDDDGPLTMDN
jgi:hypothetical protein